VLGAKTECAWVLEIHGDSETGLSAPRNAGMKGGISGRVELLLSLDCSSSGAED
jgi:hypothetical protein